MHSRQPFLHDLVVQVAAPTQALTTPAGGIGRPAGRPSVEGVFHGDVRVLSHLAIRVDGEPGEPIAHRVSGNQAAYTTLHRQVGADLVSTPDPAVRLDQVRTVTAGTVHEDLVVSSTLDTAVILRLEVVFGSDLAELSVLREGRLCEPVTIDPAGWGDQVRVTLEAAAATWTHEGAYAVAGWVLEVPARGTATVNWRLSIADPGAEVIAAPGRGARPVVRGDHRLVAWLDRALDDLDGLRMATAGHPDDVFFAAGSPWYLTLFGRDSLWAARMVLPIDPAPALGTLRTLARLQGIQHDVDTAEEPGKILHEVRRSAFSLGAMVLPPLYYGTVDATPLWICLLHDAWRAGLAEADLRELAPALEAALGWLLTAGGDDGFLSYRDASGRGLSNQGWKDSGDSIRFADGTQAEGPVALSEVQGYAYEAAISGATLLDHLDRPGGDRLRGWADALRARFRDRFWCTVGDHRFPALALDGHGRPVDALTSNIGHLLGTGLLDADEERIVAGLVSGSDLDSGLGLRTMAASSGGYAPLSYHCGSVWPHDTAIVIAGLVRAGLTEYAGGLVEGLLAASVAFGQQVPELWSGEGRPVPYPAACKPQAWSAAAAVVVAEALGVW